VAARKLDLPSIRDAVHDWLFRTPIQGSRPGDADDSERVQEFVEAFLGAHALEVNGMLQGMLKGASNDADGTRLKARFDQEMAGARAFLMANEVPDVSRDKAKRIRAALVFIESYRELPLLAWPREVLDSIVALEQAFLIFRQRHARMVERVIGRRTGTGGSAGVDYLDSTALKYRVFKDVWAVRTLLLREEALPPVQAGDLYGFVAAD
jgi:tryptophan 2,3-dioxygenase